jgi:hypothetical protein
MKELFSEGTEWVHDGKELVSIFEDEIVKISNGIRVSFEL